MSLYWGDFHRHVVSTQTTEQALTEGKDYLDVFPALLYPFEWDTVSGLKMESTRPLDSHRDLWQQMHAIIEKHNELGRFVAMMAFEWHGNRQAHGDYNVFYFHGAPEELHFPDTLEQLYDHLREKRALAFPHHTAYPVGHCGTNYSELDPTLSPATDLFSAHGSSEADGRGDLLKVNASMGPGVSGGTAVDALNHGHHIGLIASNDGLGLPGGWGRGLTGIYADELSREGVYAAFQRRSVYGVTGDRIKLTFSANNKPMGSVIEANGNVSFDVGITASDAVDRVELIRNGIVIDQHCHSGKWEHARSQEAQRAKCRFSFGWGPAGFYGFKPHELDWQVELSLDDGKLLDVEKCFTRYGNSVLHTDSAGCKARLTTTSRSTGVTTPESIQSLVFEVDGSRDTRLNLTVNEKQHTYMLGDLLDRSEVYAGMEESIALIEETFGVTPDQFPDDDPAYHNARKVKAHLAAPREAYDLSVSFKDKPPTGRESYYYLRVTQMNGQMAWSSPIWVTPK